LVDVDEVISCWLCKKLKLCNSKYNLSSIKVNAPEKNTEDSRLMVVVWLVKRLLFGWNNIIGTLVYLFFVR